MEKINFENIIKSFFLGLFIGVVLQFNGSAADIQFSYRVLSVLASGSIGFIIGFLTEWITAILPITIAKARTYFFINNFIALIVTAFIMTVLILVTNGETESRGGLVPVFLIVLSIVCAANLFDYLMYRRAQSRLKTYKEWMKDKVQ
ncbi:hypothetical protein [Paenibacillus sp. NEAU-GSW1]|uniref:hypothetical protein n=1 Tax=Paenibacillus sp. NEAU-GSW1 TaxID=2682486 RepID=UPI0012E1EDB7|nr:hypothetical protein [Paenibacillus sp. NEAU-GSW1]MUT64682.1 hypothetical protein [Paenibacillus sp. NEAU-GSW1]